MRTNMFKRAMTPKVLLAACLAWLCAPAFAQDDADRSQGIPVPGAQSADEAEPTSPRGEGMPITRDLLERDDNRRREQTPISPPVSGEPQTLRAGSPAPDEAPNVLVLLAHPDDEIPFAPVLARIAREGGTVTLVFATSGDVGPGVSGMEPGQELATLREGEGRCAAFALDIPEPIYWQLGDGELSTLARAPDSAARDMIQRITDLIAIEAPDIVMTWGPDGGYGHADHRLISAVATQVIQAMGADRPELLYLAFPTDAGAPPQGFEGWARLDPSLITDRIRYELVDFEAARIAIDCYQSQFDGAARAFLPQLLHREIWRGTVQFRAAFPSADLSFTER